VKVQNIALIVCFLTITNCFQAFSSQIDVDQFRRINGLNSKQVFNGFQSKYTRIYWFATGSGVVSFDGSKFDDFESMNPFFGTPSLKVVEDNQGFVWFISSIGQVAYFNGKKFSSALESAELESELSKGMILDFWLNELNEIMILCQNAFETKANLFKVIRTQGNKYVVEKVEMESKISKNYIFYNYNNKCIAYYNKENSSFYKSIYVGKNVYFYNNQILTQIENGYSEKELFKFEKKSLSNIQLINNTLFMSTTDGLLVYKGFGKAYKLISNVNIASILIDVDSNVIVCTLNEGIIISPRLKIEKLNIGNKYGFSNIKIESDKLYYSDKKYNLGVWSLNEHSLSVFKNEDKSFSDNNIFIRDEVIYFNKKRFILSSDEKQVFNTEFIPFQSISNNSRNFLLSTGYADVKLIEQNGKKFKSLFYGTRVYDAKLENEKLWVATKNGLIYSSVIKDNEWAISDFDTICKGFITERLTIVGDKIIFITNKKYLSVFNGNKLDVNILSGTILENKVIKEYIFLNQNTLIVLTNVGIYVSELKWGKSIQIERSKFISVSNEDFSDEYVSVDTFKNYLYFATIDNLYRVKLIDLKFKTNRQKCIINGILTNKRYLSHSEISVLKSILLENDESILEFNVVNSKLFKSIAAEELKYTLLFNGDSLFTRYLKSNILRFENLKHGKYVLKIYTRDDGSEWSIPFEIEFTIKPKLHETKLFYITILLVCIIATALFGIQVYKIKNRKLLVKILEMENEKNQLQLLKTQLNPHFLFNSLNSLKSLIYLEKSNEAISFTDKLSGFLRAVLKFDSELDISIGDELTLVNHYLSIEKSRLGNRLLFEIDCPNVLLKVKIPSNILQPIVENSIKYGLENNDQLEIKIKISQKGNIIQLFIEDNGTIIQGDSNTQNSFSLKSIENRINSFNKGSIKNPLFRQVLYNETVKVGFQVILSFIISEKD